MNEHRVWRPPDPTWRNTVANVRLGIKAGLSVAILASAIAALLSVLTWSDPFAGHRMTFVSGIATYFVGGILAGAVGGLLRPLTRRDVGKLFVGALLGVMVAVIFRVGQDGLSFWRPTIDATLIAVLWIIVGVSALSLAANLAARRAVATAQNRVALERAR
jgi:peptidoglycan/LPS O-acetylase OafA/YrhL